MIKYTITVLTVAMLAAPAISQTAQSNEPDEQIVDIRSAPPRSNEPPGQRQTQEQIEEETGIASYGRVQNRIQNRVQSRINNRIGRGYRLQVTPTSPFVVAGDLIRDSGRPRR